MRANLVLSKRTISSLELFASTVSALRTIGADYISAWPIRGDDDQIDLTLAPSPEELERINSWVKANQQQNCPVTLCPVTFLGEDTREAYQSGRKLTLFPDGTLSNTWCNNPQEGRPCP